MKCVLYRQTQHQSNIEKDAAEKQRERYYMFVGLIIFITEINTAPFDYQPQTVFPLWLKGSII